MKTYFKKKLSQIGQPFTAYKNMSQHEQIRKSLVEYTLVGAKSEYVVFELCVLSMNQYFVQN